MYIDEFKLNEFITCVTTPIFFKCYESYIKSLKYSL